MPPKRKSGSKQGESSSKKKKEVVDGSESDGAAEKKVEEPSEPKDESSTTSSSESKESVAEAAAAEPGMKCPKPPNFRIASWNVNGIRAWLKKDGMQFLTEKKPDMLLVQETKAGEKDIPEEIKTADGYHTYWQSTEAKGGYAGVGLFSKTEPLKVDFGMGIEKHDGEGRLITAEYDKFYLIGSYVPNSGRGLPRLGYRREWNTDFLKYIKGLDAQKPVIYCGDLNVAHNEIDLANPKSNLRTAGFTVEEREDFSKLLEEGDLVDSFRLLYPSKTGAYSFWSYVGGARAKNVGWRLDYFIVSRRLAASICDSEILSEVEGSDHCPIELSIHIQ